MSEASVKAEDFFKVPLLFFNLLQFNPFSKQVRDNSKRQRTKFLLKKVVCCVIGINALEYMAIEINTFINAKRFLEGKASVTGVLFANLLLTFAISLWKKREIFPEIIEDLNKFLAKKWDPKNRLEYLKIIKAAKSFGRIAKCVKISVVLLISVHAISPITQYAIRRERQLPAQMWLPIDGTRAMVYPFLFTWWLLCITAAFLILFGYFLMVFGLLALISLEFEMLARKLSAINATSQNLKSELIGLVDDHKSLISIAEKINGVLSVPAFVIISETSMLFCFFLFPLAYSSISIGVISIKLSTMLVILLQMFAMCFFSQKLIDSSLSVGEEAFNINWYLIDDLRVRRMIQVIIIRAQKKQALTAWKFAEFSLEQYKKASQTLNWKIN